MALVFVFIMIPLTSLINRLVICSKLTCLALLVIIQIPKIFDNDNSTNRYIQFQYFATNGNWPNRTLPLKLADFAFTTSANFQETQFNITGIDVAPGYTLEAAPLQVYRQNWTLDVDGNGSFGALSDGIIIMRYLFGFAGDTLTKDAIGPGATRSTSEIRSYLAEGVNSSILDIDGNGSVTALSDGIIAVRYLFGGTFSGNALINGAVAPNATRGLSDIESYLASIRGNQSSLSLATVARSSSVPQQFTTL